MPVNDFVIDPRSIRPVLTPRGGRRAQGASPPGPHAWESHEEIARMQQMLNFQVRGGVKLDLTQLLGRKKRTGREEEEGSG